MCSVACGAVEIVFELEDGSRDDANVRVGVGVPQIYMHFHDCL